MEDYSAQAHEALDRTLIQGSGRSQSNFRLHDDTRHAVVGALTPIFDKVREELAFANGVISELRTELESLKNPVPPATPEKKQENADALGHVES